MNLAEFFYNNTISYLEQMSKPERKKIGQFFTPASIANYMGSMVKSHNHTVRILDPGAGSGILSAAIIDQLMKNDVKNIIIDLYENNSNILPILQENLEKLKLFAKKNNVSLDYHILEENFIISNELSWSGLINREKYDFVISNPPYKKIKKSDIESIIMNDIVYGQPNMYFLFMAMGTNLLKENGELIFIVPRSFSSGSYFTYFRKYFLEKNKILNIHLFTSRDAISGSKDSVLQETIILHAKKTNQSPEFIKITESNGEDCHIINQYLVEYKTCVKNDNNYFLFFPTCVDDIKILTFVNKWPSSFSKLGYRMKTGIVVDFREKEWLSTKSNKNTIPLLWSYNFKNHRIHLHSNSINRKPQFLLNVPETKRLQMKKANYLLLKRFTSKEESKRLQCALLFEEDIEPYEKFSTENHLNFITKLNIPMTKEELYGLFVVINSNYLDKYFRILNGSTQVNANEINSFPLPSYQSLTKIGKKAMTFSKLTDINCDLLLEEEFIFSKTLKGGNILTKLKEAKGILAAIGMPKQQTNDRSAYVLLALANIKETDTWDCAKKNELRIVDMMNFMATHYDKVYKPNTRETIRKDTIHQFVDGAIAEKNTDKSNRPTNSPNYCYCLTDEMLKLISTYGTTKWQIHLQNFIDKQGTLIDKYNQQREINRVSVTVNGQLFSFSPGNHNTLQKAIIEDFASRFAKGAEVLYVGDTEDKDLIKNREYLESIGIVITDHDKLPDVILFVKDKNWLYFIEAVTSVGPISVKRIQEIESMSTECTAGKIYVTAFPDRKTYKKFVDQLAWETEVWIADNPDHMIHLNGDKFIGPRNF